MKNQKLNIAALATLITLGSTAPAFAYLDPGTGTMILQALAAGVAGAIVLGRMYWHRLLVMIGVRKELPTENSDNSTEQK